VIGPEDGHPVKIGISQGIEQRLAALQGANWAKLYLHSAFFVLDLERGLDGVDYNAMTKSAQRLETRCHNTLENMDLRLQGEWFDIYNDEADEAIAKVAEQNGFKLATPHDILGFDPGVLTRSDDILTWRHVLEAAVASEKLMRWRLNDN